MKIRNYIPFIALLIGVSILPSCLKEEDDIFNKSGAEVERRAKVLRRDTHKRF